MDESFADALKGSPRSKLKRLQENLTITDTPYALRTQNNPEDKSVLQQSLAVQDSVSTDAGKRNSTLLVPDLTIGNFSVLNETSANEDSILEAKQSIIARRKFQQSKRVADDVDDVSFNVPKSKFLKTNKTYDELGISLGDALDSSLDISVAKKDIEKKRKRKGTAGEPNVDLLEDLQNFESDRIDAEKPNNSIEEDRQAVTRSRGKKFRKSVSFSIPVIVTQEVSLEATVKDLESPKSKDIVENLESNNSDKSNYGSPKGKDNVKTTNFLGELELTPLKNTNSNTPNSELKVTLERITALDTLSKSVKASNEVSLTVGNDSDAFDSTSVDVSLQENENKVRKFFTLKRKSVTFALDDVISEMCKTRTSSQEAASNELQEIYDSPKRQLESRNNDSETQSVRTTLETSVKAISETSATLAADSLVSSNATPEKLPVSSTKSLRSSSAASVSPPASTSVNLSESPEKLRETRESLVKSSRTSSKVTSDFSRSDIDRVTFSLSYGNDLDGFDSTIDNSLHSGSDYRAGNLFTQKRKSVNLSLGDVISKIRNTHAGEPVQEINKSHKTPLEESRNNSSKMEAVMATKLSSSSSENSSFKSLTEASRQLFVETSESLERFPRVSPAKSSKKATESPDSSLGSSVKARAGIIIHSSGDSPDKTPAKSPAQISKKSPRKSPRSPAVMPDSIGNSSVKNNRKSNAEAYGLTTESPISSTAAYRSSRSILLESGEPETSLIFRSRLRVSQSSNDDREQSKSPTKDDDRTILRNPSKRELDNAQIGEKSYIAERRITPRKITEAQINSTGSDLKTVTERNPNQLLEASPSKSSGTSPRKLVAESARELFNASLGKAGEASLSKAVEISPSKASRSLIKATETMLNTSSSNQNETHLKSTTSSPKKSTASSPSKSTTPSPHKLLEVSLKNSVGMNSRKSFETSPKKSIRTSPRKSVRISPRNLIKTKLRKSVGASPSKSFKVSPRKSVEAGRKSTGASPRKSVETSPRKSAKASPMKSVESSPSKSFEVSSVEAGRKSTGASSRKSVETSPRKSAKASPMKSVEASLSKSFEVSSIEASRKSTEASPRKSVEASPRKVVATSPRKSVRASPRKSFGTSPRKLVGTTPNRSFVTDRRDSIEISSLQSIYDKMITPNKQIKSPSRRNKASTEAVESPAERAKVLKSPSRRNKASTEAVESPAERAKVLKSPSRRNKASTEAVESPAERAKVLNERQTSSEKSIKSVNSLEVLKRSPRLLSISSDSRMRVSPEKNSVNVIEVITNSQQGLLPEETSSSLKTSDLKERRSKSFSRKDSEISVLSNTTNNSNESIQKVPLRRNFATRERKSVDLNFNDLIATMQDVHEKNKQLSPGKSTANKLYGSLTRLNASPRSESSVGACNLESVEESNKEKDLSNDNSENESDHEIPFSEALSAYSLRRSPRKSTTSPGVGTKSPQLENIKSSGKQRNITLGSSSTRQLSKEEVENLMKSIGNTVQNSVAGLNQDFVISSIQNFISNTLMKSLPNQLEEVEALTDGSLTGSHKSTEPYEPSEVEGSVRMNDNDTSFVEYQLKIDSTSAASAKESGKKILETAEDGRSILKSTLNKKSLSSNMSQIILKHSLSGIADRSSSTSENIGSSTRVSSSRKFNVKRSKHGGMTSKSKTSMASNKDDETFTPKSSSSDKASTSKSDVHDSASTSRISTVEAFASKATCIGEASTSQAARKSGETKQLTLKEFLEKMSKNELPRKAEPNYLANMMKKPEILLKLSPKKPASVRKPNQKKDQTKLIKNVPQKMNSQVFQHFFKHKLTKEGAKAVHEATELFFENLSSDLSVIMASKNEKAFNKDHVYLLLKELKMIDCWEGLYAMLQELLPADEWKKVVPIQYAFNQVFPREKK